MTTGHKRMAVLTAKTEMISSLNVSNYERVGGRDLEYYLSSQIRSRSEQLFAGTDSRGLVRGRSLTDYFTGIETQDLDDFTRYGFLLMLRLNET